MPFLPAKNIVCSPQSATLRIPIPTPIEVVYKLQILTAFSSELWRRH